MRQLAGPSFPSLYLELFFEVVKKREEAVRVCSDGKHSKG